MFVFKSLKDETPLVLSILGVSTFVALCVCAMFVELPWVQRREPSPPFSYQDYRMLR